MALRLLDTLVQNFYRTFSYWRRWHFTALTFSFTMLARLTEIFADCALGVAVLAAALGESQ
jgi:hypothetical protein